LHRYAAGAHTCYYSRVDGDAGAAAVAGGGQFGQEEAMSTLYELEVGLYKCVCVELQKRKAVQLGCKSDP
jgi:hypothetical protein